MFRETREFEPRSPMKIGSFNIRGLGSAVKKDEIMSFFSKFRLDFGCIQETKVEAFSELDGRRIWKSERMGWSCEGAVGRSGGILSFWDESKFICSSHWSIGGVVVVVGRGRETGEDYCIINVYAPCDDDEQILL